MGKPLFKDQFSIFPQLTYCPQYDPAKYEEIQAFYFEGMPLGDEKTRVFAYMGLPRNRKWPAPAVVLVHGGGCHPDCEWIRQWTERGYIALAMDTTGYFPAKEHTSFCEADRGEWQHALPEDIKTAGYTVSPDNSEMKDIHVPLKDRWMYHAVSQVILAHNILLSDSRVDADRIGISGISWGGVISSIVIGHDRRFAFAAPIYGSAFLGKGLPPLTDPFRWPENEEWLAERNYGGLSMPVMWLCWNDDCCFSIQSNSLSYLATVKYNENTLLSMRHLMYHSHTHGYRCEESYWFADCVLNKKVIPKVRSGLRGRELWFSFEEPEAKIRLFYITQNMTYIQREKYGSVSSFMEQEWQIEEVEPKSGSLRLPEEAKGCYLEFTLKNGIVLCSPYYCLEETSN